MVNIIKKKCPFNMYAMECMIIMKFRCVHTHKGSKY